MEPQATLPAAAPAENAAAKLVPFAVAMPPRPPTLAELFVTEESALLRFAIGLVGRRMVAEELVQETFLRLHAIWAEVEQPRAWLYRSLRNLALNHLRDRKDETELEPDAHPSSDTPPDEVLGRLEAVGMMRLLLAELPAAERQLVQLKYTEGLRYEQIARRTGLSVGNVGYKLHHLLKQLADGLRRAGIEGSAR